MKKILFFFAVILVSSCGVNTSLVSVPEEGGIHFVKLTEDGDAVLGPKVILGRGDQVIWSSCPMLAISPDGRKFAYLSRKNQLDNIMVKSTLKGGVSVQRTFRSGVIDVSWSPDGKNLCFSESRSGNSCIYTVNANEGSIVRQFTNGPARDCNPSFSKDCSILYFTRSDEYGNSIWSYNLENNLLSNYSQGMNPIPVSKDGKSVLCSRSTKSGESEIWMINVETGVEQLILSQPKKTFVSPQISPDGQWIVCVGIGAQSSFLQRGNLDVFAVKVDGTMLTQLTYHPGHDTSPMWSPDGKSVYFLSQRGTVDGKYNVWKMDFPL